MALEGITLAGQLEHIRLITDIEEMRSTTRQAFKNGERVVLVPTMGGLHRGHVELIKKGRSLGELLIVSIFVNPTQFGPGEDLSTYPSDLAGDMEKAREAGADIIFHPDARALYPDGFQSFVEVGEGDGVSSNLCGASRSGHFRGVATIVTKLFNITTPDTALFGLKDYQQFTVIKRLAGELNMGIDIVGVETVREPDGLALSSRNAYLTDSEREAAVVVPLALRAGSALFERGAKKSAEIIEMVKKHIEKEPQAVIDYVLVCDPDTLKNVENIGDGALLAIAIKIGKARLIDSILLGAGRQI
jgi:pantoate--beta-alanine ligase